MKILIINGPNLQLLGTREPDVYGAETLVDLEKRLRSRAAELGCDLDFFQSNHEGELVERIGNSRSHGFDGIVINPAAYTHTSIALRDALEAVALPAIEVHISNIHRREKFRHRTLTAGACIGLIAGLGLSGYDYALQALMEILVKPIKS